MLEPAERRAAMLRIIGGARRRLVLSLFRCDDFEVLDALAGALETQEMLDDVEVVAIIGPAVPRRPGDAATAEATAPSQAART